MRKDDSRNFWRTPQEGTPAPHTEPSARRLSLGERPRRPVARPARPLARIRRRVTRMQRERGRRLVLPFRVSVSGVNPPWVLRSYDRHASRNRRGAFPRFNKIEPPNVQFRRPWGINFSRTLAPDRGIAMNRHAPYRRWAWCDRGDPCDSFPRFAERLPRCDRKSPPSFVRRDPQDHFLNQARVVSFATENSAFCENGVDAAKRARSCLTL